MLRRCSTCGSTVDVQRHHIDWSHGNNAANNLIGLFQRCHSAVHGKTGHMTRQELEAVRAAVLARDPARFAASETEVQPLRGQLNLFT